MPLVNDTEEGRWICRIMSIAFRIAKEQPPATISRSWIANYLHRSESFVTRNWNKDPFACKMDSSAENLPQALSQESKEIIKLSLAKEKKSIRELIKDIEIVRGKKKSYTTIHRYLHTLGAKPFHQTQAPKLTEKNVEDRLWFTDFLSEWDADHFLFLAPSDEFFIYEERRPNFQNDRVWALDINDIPENLKIRETSKYPACIGVFILFTAKRMMWVVKEKGQSWTGQYFRDIVLVNHVIPFLKNQNNVLDVKMTTFLHDRAPCMSSLATQNLLKANKIDFFGNGEWPGSSPDLNACENLGSILKDRVEKHLQNTRRSLIDVVNNELSKMEFETDLFSSLLQSYPARLDAVREAGGRHTNY